MIIFLQIHKPNDPKLHVASRMTAELVVAVRAKMLNEVQTVIACLGGFLLFVASYADSGRQTAV